DDGGHGRARFARPRRRRRRGRGDRPSVLPPGRARALRSLLGRGGRVRPAAVLRLRVHRPQRLSRPGAGDRAAARRGPQRRGAGALVGSLAVGTGDSYSDIDLTFGISEDARVVDVLEDWTGRLADDVDAVRLVDLERAPTTYRVFLLPGALQLDLSMTPADRF